MVVIKRRPFPGWPLLMMVRMMMMIAVKPVIKAMSFDWLEIERKEKESRTEGGMKRERQRERDKKIT